MSDFLSSLAARSFNPSEDIRPRLPARFESTVISAETQPIEPMEQDEWVRPTPQTETMPPGSPVTSPRTVKPPQREPAPLARTQTTQPETVQPRLAPTARPAPAADTQPAPFEQSAPALIPNPSPSGRREQREGQQANVSTPQGEGEDKAQSFITPHLERKGGKQRQSFEAPLPEGEGLRVRASQTPPKQAPRPSPTITPRLSAEADPRAETPATPLKPPTLEQVVRVSIGRIEVRVNTPPPKAVPKAPPPAPLRPAVSLNDYLKRREGGKS